ncbi:hypothetical protein ACFXTN_008411 [Malus domestica]
MPAEKKPKTSFAAHKGPLATKRYVIDMTSSNGKKCKAARSKHVASSMLRMASTIVDKITQRKGFIMPPRLAIMKSGKVDSAAKVAPKPAPFASEIDSPQIQDLKLAISELRFATYAKKRVDELQRVRVSLLKKNEQLKGENDGLEASIGEVVGEVSAQTGAARGEASDDAAAKSVTAVEAYAAVGVGVELCKVVSHRVGSRMPYLQKQTKVKLIDYVACRQWIKLRICALACLTFHKNVRLYKSSAASLLKGQAVGSLPESVGYLSALGSSFRIPGQPSIGCTANPGASHRASSYTRAARLIHVWIFGV